MKHYLNFKPTVVFRKISGFMLKILLAVVYISLAGTAVYFAYQYNCLAALNERYTSNQKQLSERLEAHTKTIEATKPDFASLAALESDYLQYRQFAYVCANSWKALLDRLESLIPADMRFINITMRPQRLLKVAITGETTKLPSLTDFLSSLYECEVFSSPQIKRHARAKGTQGKELIRFNIEVDYAGESGDLP